MASLLDSVENSTLLKILAGGIDASNILNETVQDLHQVAISELNLIDLVKYFFVIITILLVVNGCLGGMNTSVIERSRKKTKQYFQSLQQNGL